MSADDKRKHPRLKILDGFSFFIVIPSEGFHQLKITDLSQGGIGFLWDLVDMGVRENPIPTEIEARLYLNQTLFIPMKINQVRVVRTEDGPRKVGAAVNFSTPVAEQSYLALVKLIDNLQFL